MKKFIIFFIIMVSVMTFGLTRSRKINEEKVVTTEEIAHYKNSLLNFYKERGSNITDEEINKKVQNYKEMQISMAKSKAKGMDFKIALKTSVIVSSICCAILFIVFYLKNAQYNELFGGSFGSNNSLRGLSRFFFGRWF